MNWERHGDFSTLVIGEDVIGNVFPFAHGFAAAMQHDTMKTCRTRERGKSYVEKHAVEHHRKLCLETHKVDPEFQPDLQDLNSRDRAANTRRAAIKKASLKLKF